MNTALETRETRGWLRFGGAILFVLLAAGCSSASSSGATTQPTTAAISGSPTQSATARLTAALEPVRAASAYETDVKVDGATVVGVTGRTFGAARRLTVTTASGSIEYIAIPPKAWARQGSGRWVLVAADQAPGAPLDVLAKPLTLEAGDATATGSTFTATYPAKALGLEGDPLRVTITVQDQTLTFRYEATTTGHATSSTTTIRPAPADPIKAPAP